MSTGMSAPGPRLDLRLLGPALTAWTVDVGLLWVGAPRPVILGVALAAGSVAALAVATRRRSGTGSLVGLPAAAVALVTICLWGHDAVRSAGQLGALAEVGAVVRVEGVLDSDPRALRPLPGRRVESRRAVVTLRVERLDARGSTSEIGAGVLVLGDADWLELAWQERISVTGRLAPAEPGDDVVAVLHPTSTPELLAEAPAVVRGAAYVRERFRAATARLPPDSAGLVPALVLGDTSATSADLIDAMQASGLTHLSAVSGSNVAIVLAAALGVCRAAGLGRRWRPIVAVIVLAGFVVLARPEPSVVRAAVMGAVGLAGLGISRRRIGPPALAGAVLVLLCWDPWLARSYGFALSVLATAGLLLLARPWGHWIGRRLPRPIRGWGPVLAVPIAAQVACAPVIVLLQGSVSLVAVPANLAADPLVAPATVAGVVTAAVSVIWLDGARWLAWAAGIPAEGIALIGRTGAGLPWGSVPWPEGAGGALLLAGLTVAVALAGPWLRAASLRRPLVPLVVVLPLLAGVAPTRDVGWPLPGWALVACAVGQGDGLVLASGPGRAVLVDVGPDPALVDGCLSRLGIVALDAVVLTHFHADHVEGLPGALRGRPVGQVVTTPVGEPAYELDEVRRWTAAAGVPLIAAAVGDRYAWGRVQARVWWPARVIHEGSLPNNASLVLTVSVGELHAVLLADIEREAARAVLGMMRRDPEFDGWRIDVVKVAHHGSANRDDALLDLLAAPLALICVGLGNDYGHPASSTLDALRERGFRVLRTDLDGDLAVGRPASGPLLVSTRGP